MVQSKPTAFRAKCLDVAICTGFLSFLISMSVFSMVLISHSSDTPAPLPAPAAVSESSNASDSGTTKLGWSPHFCEGRYGGIFRGRISNKPAAFFPEWGSTITAGWILFVGMHMHIYWQHDDPAFKICAAMFFVNGVGSLLFHATGNPVWGGVDGNSMVFVAWMLMAFIYDEFHEDWSIARGWARGQHESRLMHRCLCDEKSRANLLLRFGSISFWSGSMTVCFYLMNSEGEVHTALAFAVPLVVIVFTQVLLQQLNWDINDVNREFVDKDVFDYGKFRFRIGLGCALPSALFWIVTENLCDKLVFFRWFPGHVLWHVGMSWGLMNALFYILLLRANNFHQFPVLRKDIVDRCDTPGSWRWRCNRMYFAVLPGVVFQPRLVHELARHAERWVENARRKTSLTIWTHRSGSVHPSGADSDARAAIQDGGEQSEEGVRSSVPGATASDGGTAGGPRDP